MKLGIVGLPNVGKSTLFNSLTKAGAESANYPFCTIDPNVGIVPVPDKRLQQLGDFYQSKKVTPAVIEFVDIAGLVKGASKGEGLGNQFLANIREVDAIVHVVRCFEDPNVIHVDGSIDPLRDIETIDLELIFADLEVLERRISKTAKSARMDKEAAKELEFQERLKKLLEDGKDAILMELQNEDEEKWIAEYNLLTSKPVIYAANVAEDDLADDGANNSYVQSVREYAKEHNSEVFVICAEIEAEISELEEDEKKMFLEDLGLTESGLEKLIAASYRLLGLMSFLTAGEDETRAWTIKVGTKAPQAAGKIHTDFERGFIKAEVVNYQDLLDCGSYAGAREKRFRARIHQSRGCQLSGSARLRFLRRSKRERPCAYGRKRLHCPRRRCHPVPFQRLISNNKREYKLWIWKLIFPISGSISTMWEKTSVFSDFPLPITAS